MIGKSPSNDATGTQVDNNGEVKPARGGRNEGNVACPDRIRCDWETCLKKTVRRRRICFAVAGSWHVGFRLECPETPLSHDPTYPAGSTYDTFIDEILVDSTVAIAMKVTVKDLFDLIANFLIGAFCRCGRGRVVVAAARKIEDFADRTDPVTGGCMNDVDHFAELAGLLVPRITAAFFKMSFSMRNWAFSLRSARISIGRVGLH